MPAQNHQVLASKLTFSHKDLPGWGLNTGCDEHTVIHKLALKTSWSPSPQEALVSEDYFHTISDNT